MNLEQLFTYYRLNKDKLEVAAKWVGLPLSQQVTEIGAGAMGDVYNLYNGLALKITDEAAEAKTSLHLLHKHHPNVVEIIKIAKYSIKRDTTSQTNYYFYYFILQKKYSPNMLTRSIYNMILNELDIERGEHHPRATTETYQLIPEDSNAKRAVVNKVLQELSLDIHGSLDVYTKLLTDLRAGLEFLHHNGIHFEDAHFNNIMFDKATNNFVIIDLGGGSSSPQETEPEDIVEAKVIRRLLNLYRKA